MEITLTFDESQKTKDSNGSMVFLFDFSAALYHLRQGKRVARENWNGRGIFLELQNPDEYSKMTHPYIFIDTTGLNSENPEAPRVRVPWVASQTDLLSKDWLMYGPNDGDMDA